MPTPIVEVLVNGTDHPEWTDVTADVRGDVSWRRGVSPGRAMADTSNCTMTFENLTGKYNPRNPQSTLYGSLGVGTPVRVRLNQSAPALPTLSDFEEATSITNTVTITTPTCVEGDLLFMAIIGKDGDMVAPPDGTWDVKRFNPSNYRMQFMWKRVTDVTEPASYTLALAASGTTTGTRVFLGTISGGAPYTPIISGQSYGSFPPFIPVPRGLALYGAVDLVGTAVTPTALTAGWNAIDSTLGTTWSAVTSHIGTATLPSFTMVKRSHPSDDIVDEAVPWGFDQAQFAGPLGHFMYFSVAFSAIQDPAYRYVGESGEWIQSWESAGADATADPNISGIFNRLANGDPVSALRRSLIGREGPWAPYKTSATGLDVIGYWPLESDLGNCVVGGGAAQTGSLVTSFGSITSPGSAGALKIDTTTTSTKVRFPVEWTTRAIATGEQFAFEVVFDFPTDAATGDVLVAEYGGSVTEYHRLTITLAATTFSYTLARVAYSTGTATTIHSGSGYARTPGMDSHHFRNHWFYTGIGTTYYNTVILDGVLLAAAGSMTVASVAEAQPSGDTLIGSTVPFCHVHMERLPLWICGRPLEHEETWNAVNGFRGESPGVRLTRLCVDAGVWPESVLDAAENRVQLGPQTPATLLGAMEEAARTDGGLLTESTQRLGVRYNTRTSLCYANEIAFDYQDSTILNRQLEPYDDDALIANRIQMKDNGSSAATIQVRTDGPFAAIDPPDGIGVRPASSSVSLRHQALLEPAAQWALALGTVDAPYLRTLGLNLVKIRDVYGATALADALLAMQIGDHASIDNTPVWLPPGMTRVVLTQVNEKLSKVDHSMTFSGRPAESYRPTVVADGTGKAVDVHMQRVDTEGSTLGASLTTSATAVTVYTDLTDWGTRPWTTDSNDWNNTNHGGGGLRIRINGEVMRVTNIAADTASIAHDAATEPATFTTVTPLTFTHTPTGTPKGVLVFIDHGAVSTDLITSVTYGGVAMTRVRTAADTATEAGRVYVYFLGANVPTGAQTVSIVHTGSADVKHAVSVTLTADADTYVTNVGVLQEDQANPTITQDPDARKAIHYSVIYSGLPNVSDLTMAAGMTAVHNHDYGAFVSRVDRQTTAATTSFPIGYTAASDDVAMIAIEVGVVRATQAFTVVRGIDGFTKTHDAASSVRIAQPPTLGL